MPELDYTIYDKGYNSLLNKGVGYLFEEEEEVSNVMKSSFLYPTSPEKIASGETIQKLNVKDGYIQSANFETGVTGWKIDADGDVEFNTGTFRGSVVAGAIHIPDQDTTSNSFHVNSSGEAWWGATESDFNTSKANANAYILNTGFAKFQDVEVTGGDLTDSVINNSAVDENKISVPNISAINVDIGTITAGTITGVLFKTSSSTSENRIEISSTPDNAIEFWSEDNTKVADIITTYASGTGTGGIQMTSGGGGSEITLIGKSNLGSAYLGTDIDANNAASFGIDWYGNSPSTQRIVAQRTISGSTEDLPIDQNWIPYSNTTYNLGSSSYRWNNIYSNYLNLDSTVTLNNAEFQGDLIPTPDNNWDLGSSSKAWQNIYLTNRITIDDYTQPVVYHGYADMATGGLSSDDLPSGWSKTDNGTGDFTITHSLGTINYFVQVTAVAASGSGAAVAKVAGISTNSFEVITFDSDTGAAADYDCMFILTLD